MSRIDELIAELCPDGVPRRTLGEIGQFQRGRRFTKADVVEDGIPSIHYGEIYTHYGVAAAETVSHVRADLATQLRFASQGDVVIAGVGETVEDVGKAVAWLGAADVAIHDDCFLYRHSMDPKYVSYYLQTEAFHSQKRRHVARAKVKRLSAQGLAGTTIPVPPLEVQREIVRVLDTFTALEAELEAELDAELEARRRQYAHFKSVLVGGASRDAGWRPCRLRDACDILVGFPFKSAHFSPDPSDVHLVRGDNVGQGVLKHDEFKRWRRGASDGLDPYELQATDVVLAMDRPWIPAGLKWARIEASDLPALLVQRVARLRSRPEILDQKYLGYVVSSSGFTEHVLAAQTGNTVPHLSGRSIGGFSLLLPTLDEQREIVAILDRLDALVNDLSSGLPAELVARRKQYEYYRDRLLTFKEAAA